MDIKETLATLQLEKTRVVNINTSNDFVNLPQNEELDNNINIGNSDCVINEQNDKLYGALQLQVNVELIQIITSKKINISITLEGIFSYDEPDKEKFRQMMLLNGLSTLYSIARSYILTISSMTLASGKITLPMINFLKLSELKQKEELKNEG